jgi:hypothetical protein
VHSVTAKVAQKVGVLLQDDYFNAPAREQKPKHHAGWPTTGDAAICADLHEGYLSRESAKVNAKFRLANY